MCAYDLVLVGGVPGAGKSTAIAQATADLSYVTTVDPEHVSEWLRRRLPPQVHYRAYRWLVHGTHTVRVIAHLLRGPAPDRRLVIHDPGTRRLRRRLYVALAHWSGWHLAQLYIDVDPAAAHEGQRRRGRIVRSFDQHWKSWEKLRPALAADGRGSPAIRESAVLADRTDAAAVLDALCSGSRATAMCQLQEPPTALVERHVHEG